MFQADYYSRHTHPPLRYFKGHPVYLATVIASVQVLTALLDMVAGSGVSRGLSYIPQFHSALEQPWRLVTWAFANQVSVWLLVGAFFVYSLGRRLEMWFGPKFFGALYLALILTGSVMALGLGAAGTGVYLSGDSVSVLFALFIGGCLLEPDAPFFGIEKLPMKLAGSISLGIGLLGYSSRGLWGEFWILLVMLAVMYGFLRSTGMPGRFGRIASALRHALSPLRAGGQSRSGSPARVPSSPGAASARPKKKQPLRSYEPKIRPKPDLAPERMVVEEVDGILEKIARSGMESLSVEEKEKLQRASSRLKDPAD